MNLIVLDTETSDLDPNQGACVLEVAWINIIKGEDGWQPSAHWETYVQHPGPISPHAQAVHHIRLDQLSPEAGAMPREAVIQLLHEATTPETMLVAHNAAFDSKFLPEIRLPWICTWRAAKHIWPEAPGYSNQVLRYWLGVEPLAGYTFDKYPHQALYDVATTSAILLKMLEHHSPADLLRLSHSPVRLKTIGFGKHRGMDFTQVPRDYIMWLRGQPNLDADLKHTLDSLLNG